MNWIVPCELVPKGGSLHWQGSNIRKQKQKQKKKKKKKKKNRRRHREARKVRNVKGLPVFVKNSQKAYLFRILKNDLKMQLPVRCSKLWLYSCLGCI